MKKNLNKVSVLQTARSLCLMMPSMASSRTTTLSKFFFAGITLIFFIISFPVYAAPIKITDVKISTTKKENYITIKLSSESQPHIFMLSKPDRLVLDFTNTQLAIKLNKLQLNHSIIKNIRDGYPTPKIVRLVLDLAAPVHFKTISKLPAKLVIISFFATSQKPLVTKKEKPIQQSNHEVVISHITQKKPTLLPLPLHHTTRHIIVMIDPGHGGNDTGAIGDMHTKEKDVVLQIAKQLANLINLQDNMHAVLTRNGDYYVTLHNRLVYARKNKADIFISIHADSYLNNRASGVSVYTLSKNGATSIATRWLTRRNNYSELEGVELKKLEDQSTLLRSVLIDLAQTATVKNSFRLGTSLLDAFNKITLLHSTYVEKAPFMVLKSPDIPSVLAEVGFISNPSEELHLSNKLYQHKIAVALFNGIQTYQKKYLYF